MTRRARIPAPALVVAGAGLVLAVVAVLAVLAVAFLVTRGLDGGGSRGGLDDPRIATPERSLPSPSGRFVVSVEPGPDQNGVPTWVPVVRDRAGHEVFRDGDAYSTRHGVGITWLSTADQLWVISGDVGTAHVDARPDGTWAKTDIWPETRSQVPPEIVALGG